MAVPGSITATLAGKGYFASWDGGCVIHTNPPPPIGGTRISSLYAITPITVFSTPPLADSFQLAAEEGKVTPSDEDQPIEGDVIETVVADCKETKMS